MKNDTPRLGTHLIYRKGKYKENRNWVLAKPLRFRLSTGELVIVPKYFDTDLSSSPKSLWGYFPPYGDFIDASILHDYLVRDGKRERGFCAREMLYRSMNDNPNKFDNWVRFIAVRVYDTYINMKNRAK
jgi:hypothetical protein